MDPTTIYQIYQIGRLHQQEILAAAAQEQHRESAQQYVLKLGSLLLRARQKLAKAARSASPTTRRTQPECI
jgi:hypothetical protein